jgi:glycosyltransferase involved in cell wall biosynthesis
MGKVCSTIHIGPILRILLKRARSNRRLGSYDYLFVLPAVPRGPASGGYRVVYELSRRLSRDGFRAGLVFLVDNRFIGRSESPRQWLHRFPLSVARALRDEIYIETVRRTEDLWGVDLIASVSVNRIDTRRVFATHFSTAFFVAHCAATIEKFYLIEHSEDDPSYSGKLSQVASLTYSLPLRKIVTNRKMYDRFRNEDPLFLQLGFESDFYKLSKPIESRGACILIPLLKKESKGSVYGIKALQGLKLEAPGLSVLSYGDLEPSEVPSSVDYYFGPHSTSAYSGPRNPVLKNMYNSAAVFVLPSLIEGFSLPTLEAMHCGCAVVVTDNGGIKEYVKNGVNGVIVPPGDSLSIQKEVSTLLLDPKRRIELAHEGMRTAESFSFDQSYSSFLSIMGENVPKSQHRPNAMI